MFLTLTTTIRENTFAFSRPPLFRAPSKHGSYHSLESRRDTSRVASTIMAGTSRRPKLGVINSSVSPSPRVRELSCSFIRELWVKDVGAYASWINRAPWDVKGGRRDTPALKERKTYRSLS